MKSVTFWLGILIGIILTGLVSLFVLPRIGTFDMTATGDKNILDYWGETNLDSTISQRAPKTTLPSTADPTQGLVHYTAVCIHCHGGPGASREEWAQNMLPKPPALWLPHLQELSDGELFYIINSGIRMTGMPAFGPTHSEKDIWNMVAIVRQLDTLTAAQKEQLQKATNWGEHNEHHQKGQKDS